MFIKSLLFSFVLVTTQLSAQNCSPFIKYGLKKDTLSLLCPESMMGDLDQLYEKIRDVHPNPYQYCSKEELDSAFILAKTAVRTPKNILQFSLVVSNFLKTMKDSHTFFFLRDVLFLYGRKNPIIPFYVKRFDNKFYLSRIYHDQIPLGTEILKVNELSADSLYKLANSYCPLEAYTSSARSELCEVMFGNVFNVFNRDKSRYIEFTYVDFSGDTLVKDVKTTKLRKQYKKGNWYPAKDFEYTFFKNTGHLRIYSFEPKNDVKFRKRIDRFFKRVKDNTCTSVVIDLRENKGGYIVLLEHLLSHINSEGKTYDLRYNYKRSDLDRFETLSKLKKIDFIKKAKRVYPKGMISKEYDFYKSPKGTVKSILYKKELKNRNNFVYNDSCTLIINGLSMSASVLMASWFKETNRGEIIGSPCYGSQSGTNGNPASIFLKHSGLPVSISTLILHPENVNRDLTEDLKVDQKIQVSLEDIKSGNDPFVSYSIQD